MRRRLQASRHGRSRIWRAYLAGSERGLDHVGIAVQDLAAARETFQQRLGFGILEDGKLPNGIQNTNYYFEDSPIWRLSMPWDPDKVRWLVEFLGPAWNGSTTETNLPDHWSQTENVAWVATSARPQRGNAGDLGGLGLSAQPGRGQATCCCCASMARRARSAGSGRSPRATTVGGKNNLASPSAVTDGKRVVAMFGTGDLAAYDFAGKQLWSRNLAKQYGKFALKWLYGSSPLLYRDKLYVEILQRADPTVYRHAMDESRRGIRSCCASIRRRAANCGGRSARPMRGPNRRTPTLRRSFAAPSTARRSWSSGPIT